LLGHIRQTRRLVEIEAAKAIEGLMTTLDRKE
jgi:hypothetical protein